MPKYEGICRNLNMQILIVAATRMELEPFIVNNPASDILITGVGVPSTLFSLQKKLSEKKYDWVIQAGVAGTFSDKFQLESTVIIDKDCFADLGLLEQDVFVPIHQTPLADPNTFPFEKGWLSNPWISSLHNSLPIASAITVNTAGSKSQLQQQFIHLYQPEIESMEGAAFHFVCLNMNVKFLQLRTLSNEVGERDKNKWKLNESVNALSRQLQIILDELMQLS
jgi:futalosine hydrolase